MTALVGPIYIAHPYTAPSAQLRRFNVVLAAELSTTVNRMGAATISPLQESSGREHALDEYGWLDHGLVLIRACRAAVVPMGFAQSSGCRAEYDEARKLRIPVFLAKRAHHGVNAPEWRIEHRFANWVRDERARAH